MEFTTELLMVRSIERGLPLRDWEFLTIGMIVDYVIEFNNLRSDQPETVKVAGQAEFDRF